MKKESNDPATIKQHASKANLFKFVSNIKITARQAGILSTLATGDEWSMSMGYLGSEMCVSSPAITALIDKLEYKGLVERKINEEDKRITLINLTESGRYLANLMASRWN